MKKLFFKLLILGVLFTNAQTNIGDTIKIKTLKYGSATRDTFINFPNGSQTFEKIIMKYNMRCKNGLISTQASPNLGCGEWDYSCNTFVVDSTKIELNPKTQNNPVISNFTGTIFPYSNAPVFDYYDFVQTNANLSSVTSETLFTIGTGTNAVSNILKANEKSGKTQIIVTASELISAGLTAGPINGFFLNVANAGGTANFFKVNMQLISPTVSVIYANSPTVSGFTQVYNRNYTFVNGNNRILFNTPFNWDGVSNILIDLSFTNTQASSPIIFNGVLTSSNTVMYSNNNYAIDLSNNGHVNINSTNLSTITNEISVTLWAYGNPALLPANTTILYGWSSNQTERQLNIHLPWGDSYVQFDAGYLSGGYDRIGKLTTTSEAEGQWNHWAFTKNTTTGAMKIYLNGVLWASGTSKTKPMALLNLILGKNYALNENYKGKVNELTIWNKELAITEIQNYMNIAIPPSHPNYSNLVAYYKINESTGLTIGDTKFSVNSTGSNFNWTFDRGNTLTRGFTESNIKPNLIFFKGSYVTTTNTITVRDSVQRYPNVITTYSITNNSSVTPMAHDAVVLTSTSYTYQASIRNIYDGDNGNMLTGTLTTIADGSITINQLPYFERFPYYNEIMSFVTPYGKGLNLGIDGKTWFYDVTDFTPLLKGPKRLVMAMGGQNQEQMDIDFYFIVGTPPRNVLEFNQLWQGAARQGDASISSINNDIRFNTQNVPLLSTGKEFKIRSTITGHGSEGEFGQNGGIVTHSINVNGGVSEFGWTLTQDCSINPVYPQGGTWLYERQGWCPGQASLLKQNYITPLVTPGTTVSLDYNCSAPSNTSGDYRYIAAHQLITYGGANFSTDAAIVDVLQPSNKVLYSRNNPICSNPKLVVQNTGSTTVTSIAIEYWLNNISAKQTFTWTGNLAFMDSTTIYLPIGTLWQNGLATSNNVFNAEIKTVNGVADDYIYNNKYSSAFINSDILPDYFYIDIRTNNNFNMNDYKLYDDFGTLVGSSTFTANNTVFQDYYTLTGCYRLIINDYGKDGLSWWANSSQGSGYARIRDGQTNAILKTFNSDFGSFIDYSFNAMNTTSLKEQENKLNYYVFPNPASNKLFINGIRQENATITITDVLGKTVKEFTNGLQNDIELNVNEFKSGVYFITVAANGKSTTKKIMIN